MKVVLAVNAHISKHAAQGPGKVGYAIARALFEVEKLSGVICYSVDASVDLPRDLFLQAFDNRFKRKLAGLSHHLGRYFSGFPVRRIEERYFDMFACRQLTSWMGDTLFCTKPINPSLVDKAKAFGWTTALTTSILHPRFNLEMVSKEQRRLGIRGSSVYTDKLRVEHLERALLSVDWILSTSKFFGDNYVRYGIEEEKLLYPTHHRPHEGVDMEYFSPSAGSVADDGVFRVLHVSHMTLIKGVQYLLEAWRQVESQIEGELVLFGSQDSNIGQLVRNSGIHCLRVVGPGNPLDEYRRASVFVSPSISDAGPNTVFEAMACGTPAIVSDHCGNSCFIQSGANGFVYRYDDVDRLASLILDCHRDRKNLSAVADRALETVRGFPLRNYTVEMLDMLEQAVLSGKQDIGQARAAHD